MIIQTCSKQTPLYYYLCNLLKLTPIIPPIAPTNNVEIINIIDCIFNANPACKLLPNIYIIAKYVPDIITPFINPAVAICLQYITVDKNMEKIVIPVTNKGIVLSDKLVYANANEYKKIKTNVDKYANIIAFNIYINLFAVVNSVTSFFNYITSINLMI